MTSCDGASLGRLTSPALHIVTRHYTAERPPPFCHPDVGVPTPALETASLAESPVIPPLPGPPELPDEARPTSGEIDVVLPNCEGGSTTISSGKAATPIGADTDPGRRRAASLAPLPLQARSSLPALLSCSISRPSHPLSAPPSPAGAASAMPPLSLGECFSSHLAVRGRSVPSPSPLAIAGTSGAETSPTAGGAPASDGREADLGRAVCGEYLRLSANGALPPPPPCP